MTNDIRTLNNILNLNDFDEEKEIEYKGKIYLVRDNGAVLRKNNSSRATLNDNKWTFGKVDANGYLAIAGVRVHLLVANAFLEKPDKENLVVDHIDTNRQNNRPSNLRWVTRLENIILNEKTRSKIEYETGVDIITFLNDPEKYRDLLKSPSFTWMHTLTRQECEDAINGINKWVPNYKQDYLIKFMSGTYDTKEAILTDSITKTAKQKNYKTPTEFLFCPLEIGDNPMKEYYNNIKLNETFSKCCFGINEVIKYVLYNNEKDMLVILHNNQIKNYALLKICFEDNYFIHESIGTFFSYEGALKQFTIIQGLEWTGGNTIDDYC